MRRGSTPLRDRGTTLSPNICRHGTTRSSCTHTLRRPSQAPLSLFSPWPGDCTRSCLCLVHAPRKNGAQSSIFFFEDLLLIFSEPHPKKKPANPQAEYVHKGVKLPFFFYLKDHTPDTTNKVWEWGPREFWTSGTFFFCNTSLHFFLCHKHKVFLRSPSQLTAGPASSGGSASSVFSLPVPAHISYTVSSLGTSAPGSLPWCKTLRAAAEAPTSFCNMCSRRSP